MCVLLLHAGKRNNYILGGDYQNVVNNNLADSVYEFILDSATLCFNMLHPKYLVLFQNSTGLFLGVFSPDPLEKWEMTTPWKHRNQ